MKFQCATGSIRLGSVYFDKTDTCAVYASSMQLHTADTLELLCLRCRIRGARLELDMRVNSEVARMSLCANSA